MREMEGFIDQFFEEAIREDHIPGAVFVLVKDGKIVFNKGYGYADLERRIPVDPDKSMFRVASISKLFTAMAVMQLVEEGKIELQEDVNKYLKHFQIESSYDRPITVKDLLLHTDGFDLQWYIGWFARSEKDMKPLGEFLADRLPPQIERPGEAYYYSDVGMTLAGYIVEEITGVDFVQYVEEKIFKPLDMNHSSFFQPLPPRLESGLAVGYEENVDGYQPVPFLYFNSVPAGALSISSTDMAHFMIAHLQKGQYHSARVLSEPLVREMQDRHFQYHPQLPGVGYGFHVSGGRPQTLHHGGSVPGYYSLVLLMPDQNLGFFLAVNNQKGEVVNRLSNRFFNRYYPTAKGLNDPETGSQPLVTKEFDSHLSRFTGIYRYDQYPRYTLVTLGLLGDWRQDLHIEIGNHATLKLFPEGSKWAEVEPLLFKRVGGSDYLAFSQDDKGRITHLFRDEEIARFEKITWFQSQAFQRRLVASFLLVFLMTPIIWLGDNLLRLLSSRRRRQAQSLIVPKTARITKVLTISISILYICFILGLVRFLLQINKYTLIHGVPSDVTVLLLIPPIAAFLTFALVLLVMVELKNNSWSALSRFYYSGFSFVACAYLLYLYHWDLLIPRL